MTTFEDIKLIYNQFLNLSEEINLMIEQEDYDEANIKIQHRNKLINRIINVKKTVVLKDHEKEQIMQLEQKIVNDNKKLIKGLEENKDEIGKELKDINKKVRINSAYDIKSGNDQGKIVDYSE